jgi:MoaA/NifB/PqqE/SkfB family radical SAM enzyme
MLNFFCKIAVFKFRNTLKFFNTLPISLTFSITRKCNLSCKTCNIWQDEAGDELTLGEYIKVFSSIKKRVFWITIAGGEPFLRDDIDQILGSACHYIRPRVINITTNGTFPDIVFNKVSKILESCPDTQIIINLSIDGIEDKHDYIRNKAGSFAKVLETYYRLKSIDNDNLSLGINTTVSKFNIDNLSEIINYCIQLGPDSYLIEIAEERDELRNSGFDIRPSRDKCIDSLNLILNEMPKIRFNNFSKLTQIFRKEYYNLIKETLKKERLIIPCLSGIASGQVFPNGDIWSCCVKRRVMGNLRKEGYDFRKIWYSKESNSVRQEIYNRKCYCTSVNACYTNMLCNHYIMSKLALGYLIWKMNIFNN